jgi:hypothetical protein
VITGALSSAGLGTQAKRLVIYRAWEKIVGPEIGSRTTPDTFSRGVLMIRAASATWQNELTFLKVDIIKKLNLELGGEIVKDLKIVSGHPAPVKPPAPPVPLPALRAEEATQAAIAAADIEDEALRLTFRRSMETYLRRQRR